MQNTDFIDLEDIELDRFRHENKLKREKFKDNIKGILAQMAAGAIRAGKLAKPILRDLKRMDTKGKRRMKDRG